MSEIDLERHQREVMRWRILVVLDAGRPAPVFEDLILRALHDVDLPVTPHGLRRELDYLSDRKLVELRGKDSPTWRAQLTHYGVDLVEYTTDVLPGIARPRKWF